MYKIGDFSKMSKTTIKALRYYEKEGILIPAFIDPNTSYRFYESKQLADISKIISFKQAGLSISDIRNIMNGSEFKTILENRKKQLENELSILSIKLSKIYYLLEENMNNEIFVKDMPKYKVYYREGVISNFSAISDFVLETGRLCLEANPNLKCIRPDYCYVSYLDNEYKETDIKIRYVQAVETLGVETKEIKFMEIPQVKCICIYHKGSYNNLSSSYNKILKFIEENGYKIIDCVRECYIDGCWNKDKEEDYLTEIEFPVMRK